MITFKTVSMKNFLSYGNVPTIIELNRPGTTLILGENLDDTTSGTISNGSGKTTILNALAYGLYDTPISNISKDNLVNNINKKNMEVSVEFEVKGVNYQITRTRKTKAGAAGNTVQLFENGRDVTRDSVSNTNQEIVRILGIPFDLFVRIVTFSATQIPFLDLPVRSHYTANQTDIIEELFDLKTLSEKANLLKEKIKSTEQSLDTNLNRVELLKKEHERHEKQMSSATSRVDNWKIENQQQIVEIQRKLRRLDDVDVDVQRELHNQLTDIDIQLKDALLTQRNIEQHIKEHVKNNNQKSEELEHLEIAECPYCLQKYQNANEKINECKDLISQHQQQINVLSEQLIEADNQVKLLASRHKEIKGEIIVTDLDDLLEIKNKAEQYQQKLIELQQAKNPYTEPLQELLDIKLDPIDMSSINELKDLIDHQKFLLKLLTKKDSFVRKALLNKNIPYLNQRLSQYLVNLGLPHTVEFTHEMTAEISQFGRLMDFGNLSNGQAARVNIALSFAFRDVLQNLHESVNICLLDEILDVGLDPVGVQAAARMLKRKARDENLALFVISHRDEIDSAFDRKMIVQMSKGFSYVRYEDQ